LFALPAQSVLRKPLNRNDSERAKQALRLGLGAGISLA
jgi:hypothetical protein